MKLTRLRLTNFRSYRDEAIDFDPRITTICGENNVGKSTIALAIAKAAAHASGSHAYDMRVDSPHGSREPIRIAVTLELDAFDKLRVLELNRGILGEKGSAADATSWFFSVTDSVELVSRFGEDRHGYWVEFGGLRFHDDLRVTSVDSPDAAPSDEPASNLIDVLNYYRMKRARSLPSTFDLARSFGAVLSECFTRTEEFRSRSAASRTSSTEATDSAETAGVLLNLKMHADRTHRRRYEAIRSTFRALFPQYEIEAVEVEPGSGTPTVQFLQATVAEPLDLSQVSAGVHEALTLVATLVGKSRQVLFLEHPEQHLHPHGARLVRRLIERASEGNQVIVVTHDPHFITPGQLPGIRRVWWGGGGSTVRGVAPDLAERDADRMREILRGFANKEMLFARCIVLVDDEARRDALLALAPTLDVDLDGHAVSIVSVGGAGRYDAFLALAEAIGVPTVVLADGPWGEDHPATPDRVFSLATVTADSLDGHGLAAARREARREVGTSETRVGGSLGPRPSNEDLLPLYREALAAATSLATGGPAD